MKAKVAYTYGWTDAEINVMPYPVFLEYWRAITPIEAGVQLLNIESASIGMADSKDRKKLIQHYRSEIKSSIDRSEGRLGTVQDLANAFARMRMNG